MWHKSRTSALAAALRRVGHDIDPDRLIEAAREAKIVLPIRAEQVSAPSMGAGVHGGIGYRVEDANLSELSAIVTKLIAKRAA